MKTKFTDFRLEQKRWYEKTYNLTPIQWGNPNAKVVIIGQAPSRLGQIAGKPFWDKTGEKMRREWFKVSNDVFYNPDLFYLTALGLVFPGKDKNGGDKRPDVRETGKWLTQELRFLSPDIYLLLGKMSSDFFFPKMDFGELVFKNQVLFGQKAFALPHASPLNIKWYKDHPKFLTERVHEIRRELYEALNIKK